MIKAEKYKEKIKELNYRFAVCNGEIKQCEDLNCYTCAFYAAPRSCMENMNKWLLEEYKEPILTEEEKNYLEALIEPLTCGIDYIVKTESDSGPWLNIQLWNPNDIAKKIAIPLRVSTLKFDSMENDVHYERMELGL